MNDRPHEDFLRGSSIFSSYGRVTRRRMLSWALEENDPSETLYPSTVDYSSRALSHGRGLGLDHLGVLDTC